MSDLITMLSAASGAGGGAETDPYFNQTTLLLHGDGTNGAQNNTFLDSSTNNFTITRNGNTTQGTFSPFSGPDGYWSNFFDGTNDRLTIADNAALRPGTSAFTIEAWVYRAAAGAAHTIFAKGASTPTGFAFLITSSNTLRFTDTSTDITSTGTVAANTWVHVAAVREGTGSNQLKLYINGVQDGTGTSSTNFTQTEEARIGENRGATDDFNGYISNFRYVIGTALYTSGFTPSTSPLTTTSQGATSSQVELLTCQSNRFLDNSTNGFTISPVNNPSVQPYSPFAPSAAYSPSVNGGSGYFDKSGDYLKPPNDALLTLGTNDCALEAWIYLTVNNTDNQYIAGEVTSGGSASGGFIWRVISGNVQFYGPDVGTSLTGAVSVGAWTHCLVTRASNRWRLFINGVLRGTYSDATSVTQTSLLAIGRGGDLNDGYFGGYISQFRIVNGSIPTDYQTASTTVGTSIFTPPTSPATTSSQGTTAADTELLLNFTNAGIFDNTGKNNLETVGNAQIDTTTKKYGTGSMEFDGTGDVLTMKETGGIFTFGTGDYTYECWIYTTTGATTQKTIFGRANTGNVAVPYIYLVNSTGVLSLYYSATVVSSTTAIAQNTWTHIAVCRASGTSRLFINGVLDGSAADTTSLISPDILTIGGSGVAAANPFIGYIDDVRITKGVARYTATFTPPDKAFPDL